jgi:hypothetical protein
MVVSPTLRGLFGIRTDAVEHRIKLAPSLPADWTMFTLRNLRAGDAALDVKFHRTPAEITLEVRPSQGGECTFEFEPALSLRAEVMGVELNGRSIPFQMKANESDQHLVTQFPVGTGTSRLRVRVRDDFAISYSSRLPALGSKSEGLRILSESWNAARTQLNLEMEAIPGDAYELALFNGKEISSVDGGTVLKSAEGIEKISVQLSGPGKSQFVRGTLIIHFPARNR